MIVMGTATGVQRTEVSLCKKVYIEMRMKIWLFLWDRGGGG